MIEVAEVGYSTPKQIQDIIINDAANASEIETYSIDKIKDLIENSTPEILPLQVFANNTDALAGGLSVNDFYRLLIANDISLVAVVLPPPRNFRILGNFGSVGIVDEESFMVEFYGRGHQGLQIFGFSFNGNVIEFDLISDSNSVDLNLSGFGITEVVRLSFNFHIHFLQLNNNSIVYFNPVALSPVNMIDLSNNQMVYYNSPMTSSTLAFYFNYNQMTASGYAMMENWATNLNSNLVQLVHFIGNLQSTVNTNLRSILIAKGIGVQD